MAKEKKSETKPKAFTTTDGGLVQRLYKSYRILPDKSWKAQGTWHYEYTRGDPRDEK